MQNETTTIPTLETVRQALTGLDARTVEDPSFTPAAVLLLLQDEPDGAGIHVVFQKRSEIVEHHKGEICFPGGARDPEDADTWATALREAFEEMGIDPGHVGMLGRLDDVTTRTRFVVATYVATIPTPYDFVVSEIECAEVLRVPLSSLLDPANIREEARWVDGALQRNHTYAFRHHLIYGATARILEQFLDIVRPVAQPREG